MPTCSTSQTPLMGTDVVRVLRFKGSTSILCSLSANDCGSLFLQAGAGYFHVKSFPCEKEALCQELVKILGLDDGHSTDTDCVCLGVKPTTRNPNSDGVEEDLPVTLSVFYVDDSPSLRKLLLDPYNEPLLTGAFR